MLASKKKILDRIEAEQAEKKDKRKKEQAEKRRQERMQKQAVIESEDRAMRNRFSNGAGNPLNVAVGRRIPPTAPPV